MEALVLFGKGLFIGLAIAAPIGPMGALCIQRTLARGFWAGVAGGLGTALADLTFATGAAVGFAVFNDLVERIAVPLGLIGGAFLMVLAWNGWPRGQGGEPSPAKIPEARGLWRTTFVTYGLTITNPPTILLFAAIFAGLGLAQTGSGLAIVALVAGVFLGSIGWWAFLSGLVAALHHRLPPAFALWTARVSSLTMAGFGLWAFASIF
ncbi:LysE family translocator [Rhodobacter capsulatus]|uniref:Lysine exporter protein (LYSE/YGGA) n=1 Tax=Rhodobacter capsulatus (strain ATCC BAA-309 / NBRC 16581 / SB1003) TaxID=272942 RepID=D5AUK9_RHOCB|nr:LysE family transporter [Rhodobacter capsulatus]ADE85648.1 lysine exporter protein (LYSE/YGGA) [Rhodobacter capsulatus SB 1003]ETD01676.1 lysine transporter LysE [Rhodobacter capsulatus DE442]ETD76743.1 lysine transporter LysE [Rhodobacter capsulatus R121]ETE53579.1 lysine transporter LysE [Rhodobacter capsulatus Y262]MDS0927378.1 LysE family transporter [Rhodobacter capsulatus]